MNTNVASKQILQRKCFVLQVNCNIDRALVQFNSEKLAGSSLFPYRLYNGLGIGFQMRYPFV